MAIEILTKDFYTSRQAAKILSVSLRTVQLWEKSGILTAWKTAGGHRRIEKDSIKKLLDKRAEQLACNVTRASRTNTDVAGLAHQDLRVLVVEDEVVQSELYRIMFAR
ncbi:MAG: helix-turn-helix domain-containing protein, partial [Thiohalomonadales bacterium]